MKNLLPTPNIIDNYIANVLCGDISNTAEAYAKAYYNIYKYTAITINPLMGEDSLYPFLHAKHQVVIPISFFWGIELSTAIINWAYMHSIQHPPGMIKIILPVNLISEFNSITRGYISEIAYS